MSDSGLVLTVDVIYFAISANVCHVVSFCVVTPLRGEFAIRAFCPPYEAVLRVGSSAVEEREGVGRKSLGFHSPWRYLARQCCLRAYCRFGSRGLVDRW